METQAACISVDATLRQAGHRMRELGLTVLPVHEQDGQVRGTVSVEMIVKGIAAGGDPKYLTVGELTLPLSAEPGISRLPGRQRAALPAVPRAARPARGRRASGRRRCGWLR